MLEPKFPLFLPPATVAALELSRSKLATWASLGVAVGVFAGWVVEAALK